MNYPDIITVTIEPQIYDSGKYIGLTSLGFCQRCYLEEALDKAGFLGSHVSGGGYTWFDSEIGLKPRYETEESFGPHVVRDTFSKQLPLTVTLKRIL